MDKFFGLSDHGCRVLIEHLQDGIIVIEDEKFTYVNQLLADIFSYSVMSYADNAMYQAKAMGRNRAVAIEEPC